MTPTPIARLHLGRRPAVHLCIRDSEAGPEDRLFAVRICDDDGDTVIALQADGLDEGLDVTVQGAGHRRWLNLGHGHSFELIGYTCYVGNVLWDAGYMGAGAARRLVSRLLDLGWHVEEVAC